MSRLDRFADRLERWAGWLEALQVHVDRVALIASVVGPWCVGAWLGGSTATFGFAKVTGLHVSDDFALCAGLVVGPLLFGLLVRSNLRSIKRGRG